MMVAPRMSASSTFGFLWITVDYRVFYKYPLLAYPVCFSYL